MPEIIVMENVTDVARHKVYHDFVSHLKNLGYHVSENNVSCVVYGIPQKRKRQIVLCSRLGPIDLLPKTHETTVTVREAIGHLPHIESGEVDPLDPLHRAAKLSDVNLKRIKASVAGGTWCDWPEELRIDAHKKASGATYASVYGRMIGNSVPVRLGEVIGQSIQQHVKAMV